MKKGLSQIFSGKNKKEQAMIVILVGVLCLIVVWPVKKDTKADSGTGSSAAGSSESTGQQSNGTSSSVSGNSSLNLYVENQEERLRNMLQSIDGAGQVKVMIRAKASKEYVVEKDTSYQNSSVDETDAQGGSRKSMDGSRSEASIYTKDSNGNDIPYVVKEMEPEIEGIVVACEGGGEERIADEIMEAVQALFDIPAHKVKVVKLSVDGQK